MPHLAICKPHDDDGLLLLHCDESWEILGLQDWNGPGVQRITAVEAMKLKAKRFYEGLMACWIEVSPGTSR